MEVEEQEVLGREVVEVVVVLGEGLERWMMLEGQSVEVVVNWDGSWVDEHGCGVWRLR